MPKSSRRRFLAITGASAVAIGATAAAPGSFASAAIARSNGTDARRGDGMLDAQPMIVCVDDLSSGQISVMHGDREFATTDANLARRIAQLAGLGA
jgi:hypothetical protein